VSVLAETARRLSAAGTIDDVRHLRRTKVYTFCGQADPSLNTTQATRDFFAELTPPANVLGKFDLPAGHGWPEADGLLPCRVVLDNLWPTENCGYDGPGALLQHVYGPLEPPAERINEWHLHRFDQRPFNGDDAAQVGLTHQGWVYVPKACAGAVDGLSNSSDVGCRLHVSLHGCEEWFFMEEGLVQGSKALGLSFNRWAETNRIVVLWPHVGLHGGPHATREQKLGCWDGYGQTGANYDTKNAVQMQAVRKMIEALSGASLA